MGIRGTPILLDLHNLRLGSFWDSGADVNGKMWVDYIPIGSLGPPLRPPVRIRNIDPGALMPVTRNEDLPGTFAQYMVLLSGEHGRSWFLEDKLRMEYPQLLRQMRETKEDVAIKQAAIATRERQAARGEQSSIADVMRMVKTIGAQRQEDEKKNKYFRGDQHGR